MNDSENDTPKRGGLDYRTVWRWHFYAGLICIPFVVMLSITGAIYLFKQEVEDWLDLPYDRLSTTKFAKPSEHVSAALASAPGSRLQGYHLPTGPGRAVRVIVSRPQGALRVYVHPETLEILHTVPEESRLMRMMFKLHGELLMGNRGSAIVEIASSWTIILIITGLFLWWPRGSRRLGGVVYPRLGRGSRIFWRDIHSVSGMWISGLALFLLLTGLPWAKFWGDHLKNMRRLTGTAVARQDWSNGEDLAPSRRGPSADEGHSGMHPSPGSLVEERGGRRQASRSSVDLAALDRIVETVQPLELDPPVVIAPPGARSFDGTSPDWTAKSMTANRPRRVDLVMEADSGAIRSRKDFGNRHVIDRVIGTGIAAHEGRLFGVPNQILGLITALGLILLCVSSVVLWWNRRESGVLGAPQALVEPRWSFGLIAIVAALAVYLPLFGATLVIVIVAERLILRRIPPVRRWLGLGPAAAGRASVSVAGRVD